MKDIKTYGLTHIAFNVKDIERTLLFYQTVFDMEIMYKQDGFIQLTTPGAYDILVFEEKKNYEASDTGGIQHFGFRLRDASDIESVTEKITEAGGIITEKGEFIAGEPYVFFKDPDGYLIEVWYEKFK